MKIVMRKYASFLVFLLLVACSKSKEKRPANLVGLQTMAYVLADMHIADGIVNSKPGNLDSNNQMIVNYREYIYKKYDLDHEQFKSSYDYYVHHPVELDSVYSKVIEILSRKEVELREKR